MPDFMSLHWGPWSLQHILRTLRYHFMISILSFNVKKPGACAVRKNSKDKINWPFIELQEFFIYF